MSTAARVSESTTATATAGASESMCASAIMTVGASTSARESVITNANAFATTTAMRTEKAHGEMRDERRDDPGVTGTRAGLRHRRSLEVGTRSTVAVTRATTRTAGMSSRATAVTTATTDGAETTSLRLALRTTVVCAVMTVALTGGASTIRLTAAKRRRTRPGRSDTSDSGLTTDAAMADMLTSAATTGEQQRVQRARARIPRDA